MAAVGGTLERKLFGLCAGVAAALVGVPRAGLRLFVCCELLSPPNKFWSCPTALEVEVLLPWPPLAGGVPVPMGVPTLPGVPLPVGVPPGVGRVPTPPPAAGNVGWRIKLGGCSDELKKSLSRSCLNHSNAASACLRRSASSVKLSTSTLIAPSSRSFCQASSTSTLRAI